MVAHAVRGALRTGHVLQSREGGERHGRCRVHACLCVGLRELAAQHHADVAVVGKYDMRAIEQVAQDRLGIPAPPLPQLGPEVAIERHLDAQCAGRARCRQRRLCGFRAQRRAHPGQVQPLRALQQYRPVVAVGTRVGESRIGTVVDHFAGAMPGAGGQEIQAHASIAAAHA
ncbi:hypothetical protein D3C81_1108660 [compost metagenome]